MICQRGGEEEEEKEVKVVCLCYSVFKCMKGDTCVSFAERVRVSMCELCLQLSAMRSRSERK